MSYGFSLINNEILDFKTDKIIIRKLDTISGGSSPQKFKGQDLRVIYSYLRQFYINLEICFFHQNFTLAPNVEPLNILESNGDVFNNYGWNNSSSLNKLIFQVDNILINDLNVSEKFNNLYNKLLQLQSQISNININPPQSILDSIPREQLDDYSINNDLTFNSLIYGWSISNEYLNYTIDSLSYTINQTHILNKNIITNLERAINNLELRVNNVINYIQNQ